MSLTKKQSDKTPAKHFAVPETEQLPIEDEVHVKMAWKMVDKTKGLSEDQRKRARNLIIERAHELGMDTSGWDTDVKADSDDSNEREFNEMEKEQEEREMQGKACFLSFSALSMEIPDQDNEHPNRAPFSGVLTKLDEPSDNPLNGSNGKCVILPKSVAEKALSTLLGMGVDSTPDLDGHDAKRKIGVITEANIVGNEIQIAGYFYAADFPIEIKRIQAEKSQLGFSYEAQAYLKSMNDDPLVMKDCVFTGAAVLYKDMAAYTTTSLAANKSTEINPMQFEELKKMLEAMQEKMNGLETKLAAQAESKKVEAGNIMHMVKPHADNLRSCAASMAAAGMGMHASKGHVAVLNNMADNMEAEGALGKMPHVYQTPDFYSASKEDKQVKVEETAEFQAMSKKVEEINTLLTDMSKAKFDAAASPERKTLTPAILHLLAKAGIEASSGKDAKLKVKDVDKALKDSNLSVAQRFQLKMGLQEAGQI